LLPSPPRVRPPVVAMASLPSVAASRLPMQVAQKRRVDGGVRPVATEVFG
jgi:hypothetical protein